MSWKIQRTYWIWKIKRERGLFLLASGLGAVFAILYYIHATGFWTAAKNPPEFVSGTLVKIWQPSVTEVPNYITWLKVELDDGLQVQLKGTGKLIIDCSIGDTVEILKYTNENGQSYFRIGPRACLGET